MHDRIDKNEVSSNNFEDRRHDYQPWVNKYLDLADAALDQRKDERERTAA